MIKNQIRYLATLIMLGFLAVLYHNYVLSLLFCKAFILPVILYGILLYTGKRTKIKLYSTVHVSKKNEEIPIRVELQNPTIFPLGHLVLYIEYYNQLTQIKYKKKIRAYMDNKTSTTIIMYAHSNYIGNLAVTLKKIRFLDFIGFSSISNKCNKTIHIGVLPERKLMASINDLANSISYEETDIFSQHKSGDDPSEVFAIREYKEGDRLQRIHWKLTMKTDQIMIKEFSEPMDCAVLLVLDLVLAKDENSLLLFDGILEEAISRSFQLMEQGIRHYIAWYDCNHRNCRRVMINTEKDIYELLNRILQSNFYCSGTEILDLYVTMYERDHYAMVYSYHTLADQIDFDALMKISAEERQVIVPEVLSSFDVRSSNKAKVEKKIHEKIGQMGDKSHIEGIADELGIAYRKIKLKPQQGDWSKASMNRKLGIVEEK